MAPFGELPHMLTALQVRELKPGGQRKHYDGRGLYLEVREASEGAVSKWWRFKYRFDGKEKLLALGTYPEISLARAREKRDEARALLDRGIDPARARKDEAAARAAALVNTFEAAARAWLAHRAGKWKAGTRDLIEASLENHVFGHIGRRPLGDIKPADVRHIVKAIEAAGASDTARRVFQRVRAVFRYAIADGLVEADPTYALKPAEILKPHRVQHRAALSEADAPEFLRKLEAYEGEPTTKGALELLVLTAARPGEVRGAAWEEFDFSRALWRIPGARMKMGTEHLIPLSTQARAVLERMRAFSGQGKLVFPSPFYPQKTLSENTLNSALARLGYKGLATAHGMRTLFSTAANEAGWPGDLVEKQLAHEERNEVRAAYNRAKHVAERARLMQWWADRLDELRRGAEVLPFKAA
jgi:integrase